MEIKRYRIKKGYTQESIARMLEVSLNTYQKYEYGELLPNIITGLKLAKLLDVDPYVLFDYN